MEDENEIKIEYEESVKKDPLNQSSDIDDPKSEAYARAQMEDNRDDRRMIPISKSHETTSNEQQQGQGDSEDEASNWYKAVDVFGKYICHFCARTYATLPSLRFHVKTKHPDEVESLKRKTLENRRKSQTICHLCKTRFKYVTELTSHLKKHDLKTVAKSCRFCNAAFNDIEELRQHLNASHNEFYKRMHICHTCGYRTNKLSHFKQHSDTHLKVKRLKCSHCNYATNHSSNFNSHIRIHTKIKPFVCEFKGCGRAFTDVTGWNFHVQKHYPEKNMLHCDKCSYKTVYKPSLKVHIESHMRR